MARLRVSGLAVALTAFLLAMAPCEASGQIREGLELYLGPGYFSSPLGRQPSKPTIEAGATFWFGPRWGVGGAFGVGRGDDRLEVGESLGPTLDSFGRGKLRFRRFMIERRIPMHPDWDLLVGAGFLAGVHADFLRDRSSGAPEDIEGERGYGYVNFEALARWRIGDRFGLRGGLDFSIPLVVRASLLASFELG